MPSKTRRRCRRHVTTHRISPPACAPTCRALRARAQAAMTTFEVGRYRIGSQCTHAASAQARSVRAWPVCPTAPSPTHAPLVAVPQLEAAERHVHERALWRRDAAARADHRAEAPREGARTACARPVRVPVSAPSSSLSPARAQAWDHAYLANLIDVTPHGFMVEVPPDAAEPAPPAAPARRAVDAAWAAGEPRRPRCGLVLRPRPDVDGVRICEARSCAG